jgi:DNA-binding CsgD family transcriptional regulator
MLQLGSSDLGRCLDAVNTIGEASAGAMGFARGGVAALGRLVPSELTTFSVCDLGSAHRSVLGDRPGAIPRAALEAFDRHFDEHPLVRDHRDNPRARTRRLSDLVSPCRFRHSALFDEYYRPIGIDHAMAVPIHVDPTRVVGFVFNRHGRDFCDRDMARVEAIRLHLGGLYRLGRALEGPHVQWSPSPTPLRPGEALTDREAEVLRWVAAGKTDRDIADILAISPRTVHKHLQRVYEKLGVETRTAAVARAASAHA